MSSYFVGSIAGCYSNQGVTNVAGESNNNSSGRSETARDYSVSHNPVEQRSYHHHHSRASSGGYTSPQGTGGSGYPYGAAAPNSPSSTSGHNGEYYGNKLGHLGSDVSSRRSVSPSKGGGDHSGVNSTGMNLSTSHHHNNQHQSHHHHGGSYSPPLSGSRPQNMSRSGGSTNQGNHDVENDRSGGGRDGGVGVRDEDGDSSCSEGKDMMTSSFSPDGGGGGGDKKSEDDGSPESTTKSLAVEYPWMRRMHIGHGK